MFPKLITLFIVLVFFNSLKSQTVTRFELVVNEKISMKNEIKTPKYDGRFFKFYKNFLSNQDGNSCGFYPSCSQYAVEAIKTKGVFWGILAAFDRMSRCNGGNHQFYLLYKNTQKQLDLPK